METNHLPAVQKMIDILLMDNRRRFSFVDVGCGNGYVVRRISELKQCVISVGMDGAKEMIKKAKKMDPSGNYYCSNIIDWVPKLKFDYIHSMEVMYYLEDPEKTIKSIVNNWLEVNGVMIMGILRNGLNLMNVSVFWQQVLIGSIIILAVYIDVLRRQLATRT